MTNCSEEEKIVGGTLDLDTYFGFTAQETADLVNFTTLLETAGHLTADHCPTGYEDKNWPEKIVVPE